MGSTLTTQLSSGSKAFPRQLSFTMRKKALSTPTITALAMTSELFTPLLLTTTSLAGPGDTPLLILRLERDETLIKASTKAGSLISASISLLIVQELNKGVMRANIRISVKKRTTDFTFMSSLSAT